MTTRQITYHRPAVERLRAGAPHLQYECVCFYQQSGLLLELFAKPGPSVIAAGAWDTLQVALVEAWLVHVRALMMAFREHRLPKFPHDLLFRDYLTPSAWDTLRDQLVPDTATQARIDELGVLWRTSLTVGPMIRAAAARALRSIGAWTRACAPGTRRSMASGPGSSRRWARYCGKRWSRTPDADRFTPCAGTPGAATRGRPRRHRLRPTVEQSPRQPQASRSGSTP